MKILTFTSLYPNQEQIRHGIFIEQRLRQLKKRQAVELKVVAPVPWFPLNSERFKEYSVFARVPKHEVRHDIEVFHPRYPLIPKVGMTISPLLMAVYLYPAFKRIIRSGYDFDVIDAHFFYPDGVAAVILAKWLKKKVTVTARGSDISVYPDQYLLPGKMIKWAIERSNASITVCKALADKIRSMNVRPKALLVSRNGVDLELFRPENQRNKLRKKYLVQEFVLVSVGNLIELKGHHLIIEALASLKEAMLIIVGAGPMELELKALAKQFQVESRVRFVGVVEQSELRDYYAVSDCLVLASSREGLANVLLESMACGTPVAATAIWGTPEVVAEPAAGVLFEERSPAGIVKAVQMLQSNYPDREQVRKYAEKFGWDETCQGLYSLFDRVIQQ